MSYNREDYARIKAEFSGKYRKAQQDAEERRLELYAAVPEVRQIDGLLARTGLDIMEAIRPGSDPTARVAEIRQRNEQLYAHRAELLVAAGYPADYSDVKYECEQCGDTGFVDTKMCGCMRRALAVAGYESSGIGHLIHTQSFDNFSMDYYGAGAETVSRYLQELRQFATSFDRDTYSNFLMIGGTGLGKTHLSTAVAKEVIDRGFDVMYVTAVSMFHDFEAKQFDKGVGMRHPIDRYMEAELLIVDDLGTEVTTQFTVSWLYELVNTRLNRHLCTFINTNLSAKDMENRYSERTWSRILGEYNVCLFKGTDIRRQRLERKIKEGV